MPRSPLDQFRWKEERLRYQVLRFIFDQVGPHCDVILTGPQIGVGLALRSEDVLRALEWLDQHGYVHHFGVQPEICLTPRAVAFFTEGSERRRSLRD